MKALGLTLIALFGSLVIKAQSTDIHFFKYPLVTTKARNNVCTCNTNQLTFLKSKANADWFQKTINLSIDTVKYKPSQSSVYSNILISSTQSLNATTTVNPDNMPIAKLNNTDPGMPIIKTDRTAYTMPVAGKSQPTIYYMQKPEVIVVQKDTKP
ncbi:MAG: hypothetical protein JWR50_2295 [Mucilaginibacter sp.]|nr:hypothetical protein [Mucilaginibacter sp.]